MKSMKLPMTLFITGAVAASLMTGCDEKKNASQEKLVEDVTSVQVANADGSATLTETVTPTPTALKPNGPEMIDVNDPKLWAFMPDVLAKVGGREITKKQFVEEFARNIPDGKLPAMYAPMLPMIAYQQVNQQVNNLVMTAAAEKAGFKPSAELVKELMNKQFKQLSKEQYAEAVEQAKQQGKTIEGMIDELAATPQMQQQAATFAFIDKEVLSKINITEEQAKQFYDENQAEFTEGDPEGTVRASHILIMAKKDAPAEEIAKAKAKAEEILAQIRKDNASFEALAEKESACPSGKQAKGSLGVFGKGQMVKEFEDVAFQLKEGEVSGVVQTEFGFHIIRRDKSVPAKVQSFEQVKPMLIEMLKQEAAAKEMPAFLEKIKKAENAEVFLKAPEMPGQAAK